VDHFPSGVLVYFLSGVPSMSEMSAAVSGQRLPGLGAFSWFQKFHLLKRDEAKLVEVRSAGRFQAADFAVRTACGARYA
jgi:hypothetical protein